MRLFNKIFKNDDKVEQLFKNFITYDSPDKPLVHRLRDILSADPVKKFKATPTVSNENIKNPEEIKKYFTGKGLKVVFKKSCPSCGVKTFVKQRPDCTCDKCGNIGRVIPVNVDEIA
jgi:hypothetical protein